MGAAGGGSPDTAAIAGKGRPGVVKGLAPDRNYLMKFASGVISGSLTSVALQATTTVRLGTVSALRLIVKQDGVAGLWRGTTPTVVRMGFGAGMYFVLLDGMKSALQERRPNGELHLSNTNTLLAGSLSRAMAAIIMCPVTVVKTRMEYTGAGRIEYRNMGAALMQVAREERLRGLFRGVGPTVATNAPFSGIYYLIYSRLRQKLAPPGGQPDMATNMVSGTLAAVAATLATQPTDILRTRMQLTTADGAGVAAAVPAGGIPPLQKPRGMGYVGIMRRLFNEEGKSALLKGSVPRLAKRTLQTAVVWTIYEEVSPRLVAMRRAALGQQGERGEELTREERERQAGGVHERRSGG